MRRVVNHYTQKVRDWTHDCLSLCLMFPRATFGAPQHNSRVCDKLFTTYDLDCTNLGIDLAEIYEVEIADPKRALEAYDVGVA